MKNVDDTTGSAMTATRLIDNRAPRHMRRFMAAVKADLESAENLFHDNALRDFSGEHVGVEQELQFVDRSAEPAAVAELIAEALPEPGFQKEFSQFTFEIALEPSRFEGRVLSRLNDELSGKLRKVSHAGRNLEVKPSLLAILPSLRAEHINPGAITPAERYTRLHEARKVRRGGGYEYRIDGLDRLAIRDDDILLAGAFTSLQVHWQLASSTGASEYNWAQAIAAPCLAAAAASPLLLGHRLWHETRIPLFEQTSDLDCRHSAAATRRRSRAGLGQGWISSILDIWHEDVAYHEPLLGLDMDGSRLSGARELKALQFFNSTVYRWNRLCYGTQGTREPALRIEARMLPSGPTLPDEIANAAFWWGLMVQGAVLGASVPFEMTFDQARENFRRAARDGLECHLYWTDGQRYPAGDLIENKLVPLALNGLKSFGIKDAEEWLDPLIRRVSQRRSPSRWMLDAYEILSEGRSRSAAARELTRIMMELADEAIPVCDWPVLGRGAAF